MATWKDLNDYQRVAEILDKRVNHDLSVFYGKIKHLPPKQISDALVQFVPALIDKYGSVAASAAADWFERLTDLGAYVPDLYKPEAWEANTRWALNPLFDGRNDTRAALVNLVEVAQRGVKNHARLTIAESVKKHPGVKYARVLSGPTNCSFCIVLASRGPVYGDEDSALAQDGGERYHTSCDCIAVPMRGQWIPDKSTDRGYIWDGDKVASYNFEELYSREYKPFHAKHDSIDDVVSKRDKAFREWQREEKKRAK